MDREARQQSFFLIRRLVSEGTGVVIASHDHQIIGQLGDQHLHLADGGLREMDLATASAGTRIGDCVVRSAGEAL
jgi:ABC-type ATPase involved in cell division